MATSLINSTTYRFRWAVFGTSFISGVMVRAIKDAGGEVHCVAGRNREGAIAFCEEQNITRVLSFEEALADFSVDVVYFGLPTYVHAKWVVACVKAGKHVLCKKSFTVNAREAYETINFVREAQNVFLMEA